LLIIHPQEWKATFPLHWPSQQDASHTLQPGPSGAPLPPTAPKAATPAPALAFLHFLTEAWEILLIPHTHPT
jgi:hypothetical protein